MKFQCEKEVLLKEITTAHEIISSKNILSILSNVLLEASDGKLRIQATDLKVNFETDIPVTVEIPGNTTIYSDKFLNILRAMPDGEILFELNNNQLGIKNAEGNVSFELNTIPAEKFPEIKAVDDSHYFDFSQEAFIEMITQTIFSVSDDESRYYMTGVLLEKNGDQFHMVGTDGKRLSIISKNINSEIADFNKIIVPPKILSIIKKLASGEGTLRLAIFDRSIYVQFDNQKLSSTLIDGDYPNYQKVIPEEEGSRFTVNRQMFINAIRSVSVVSEQKSKRVYLEVEDSKIHLRSEDGDVGKGDITINCTYTGEKVIKAINYVYLMDPLKVIEDEEVEMLFSAPGKAIQLISKPRKDFTHIIMPMSME